MRVRKDDEVKNVKGSFKGNKGKMSQITIIPCEDIPCTTDYGLNQGYIFDRTLYKGLEYNLVEFDTDDTYIFYKMWDDEGFIGNYRVPIEYLAATK